MSAVVVRPQLREFVAEVEGVSLSAPLPPEAEKVIRCAFRDHPVLVFHGQSLTPGQLMAFGERFGTLAPHSQLRYRVEGFPACSWITNRRPDGSVDEFGQTQRAAAFHSDGSFKAVPDSITILHGVEVPSTGGGTDFADCRAAYQALPEAVRVRIATLRARHRLHKGVSGTPGPASLRPKDVEEHPGSVHPVVRTHPDTGRRSVFVNPVHTERIEGLGETESRDLLAMLYAHCTQPAFVHSHRWHRGDVVMWDQRCTLHRAAGGAPPGEPRVLLRTMIVTGDVPA